MPGRGASPAAGKAVHRVVGDVQVAVEAVEGHDRRGRNGGEGGKGGSEQQEESGEVFHGPVNAVGSRGQMGPESEPQGKRCLGDRGRRAPGRFASNRHGWAAAPPWKPTLR